MALLAIMTLITPLVTAFAPCPPLGPVFPVPTNLHASKVLQEAFINLTSNLDAVARTGKTPYGDIPINITTFSVGIFDKSSTEPLLSYQHTSRLLRESRVGTKEVDADSIYRIGSLSKLVTAYLLLVNGGSTIWNKSVTDFIPELAGRVRHCPAKEKPIDCVDWDQVTLGSLASHQAGILRDYSGKFELLNTAGSPTEFGLPELTSHLTPSCNALISKSDPLCSRAVFLDGLASEHPIYLPYTTPIYSNAAYALLGLVLEKITGRPFADVLKTDLLEPLNMTGTSYDPPADIEDAVVPGNLSWSGFDISTGLEAPDGGFFSTQDDLQRLGQSILSATLLDETTLRRWLKPETHTSYGLASVGKPWEIWTVPAGLTSHLFDRYTKSGDIYQYSTIFVLSPDHQVGFVVLAAGEDPHSVARDVGNIVAEGLFPAVDEAARQEAHEKLAGRFSSSEEGLNSSITLTTGRGRPGLLVTDWISNGTDFLSILASQAGSPLDVRLYPTNLQQSCGGSNSYGADSDATCVSFRAVFQGPVAGQTGGIFSQGCITWDTVDLLQYGGVGLDEFVFGLHGDGEAFSLSPRALRTTLLRGS